MIAVCAAKGRPGVTTSALALAAVWPRPVALAEMDASGGDLSFRLVDGAGRFVLAPTPGLLTWVAAIGLPQASATAGVPVWEHCQTVGGVPVLSGLTGTRQAAGLSGSWPGLAVALSATAGGDVLADLGRMQPGSPVTPVVAAADLLVVVMTGSLESLVRTRSLIRDLLPVRRSPIAVVIVASDRDGPRAVRSVQDVLDHDDPTVQVAGLLAADPDGVTALCRGEWSQRLSRSLLARTARQVAATLADWLAAAGPTAALASTSAPGRGPAHDFGPRCGRGNGSLHLVGPRP